MKIFTLPLNKLSHLYLFFLVITFTLINISCKKTDLFNADQVKSSRLTNKFFSLNGDVHPLVSKMVAEISRRNTKHEFIENFATTNGLPVWDKAIITAGKLNSSNSFIANSNSQQDSLVYVPLVLENTQQVNGFVRAVISDSIYLSYCLAKDYKNYPFTRNGFEVDATEFSSFLMLLDHEVFGHKRFNITDLRLFDFSLSSLSQSSTIIEIKSISTASPSNLMAGTITSVCWLTPTENTLSGHCTCGGGFGNCWCWNDESRVGCCGTRVCVDIITGTGSGIPGFSGTPIGGGLPASGGSGDIPPYYPCQNVIIQSLLPEPLPPCPPPVGGSGWDPYAPLFDYSHLDNPILVNDDMVTMPVGFNFLFENFNAILNPPLRIIGKVAPRGNTEDMDWQNCNSSGILSNMLNLTDQQLFNFVEDLFHKTSTGSLETVGDDMIAKFRNSLGGTYSNGILNQKVFDNSNF